MFLFDYDYISGYLIDSQIWNYLRVICVNFVIANAGGAGSQWSTKAMCWCDKHGWTKSSRPYQKVDTWLQTECLGI